MGFWGFGVVDDILLELKTEIMVHVAMLNEMIHAKCNTMQVDNGEDDQLTKDLKRELEILKRMKEKEENVPPAASDGMEEVTDGARALDLGSATVREMAEEKAEVSSSSEA